jgi:hypothetical protein
MILLFCLSGCDISGYRGGQRYSARPQSYAGAGGELKAWETPWNSCCQQEGPDCFFVDVLPRLFEQSGTTAKIHGGTGAADD